MREKDVKRLDAMRAKCPQCKGTGVKEEHAADGTIILRDCTCVERVSFEIKMIEANIPKQYRYWKFKQLLPQVVRENKKSINIIQDYVAKLPKNIEDGVGLWLNAPPGLAKSSMICAILKRAIEQGFTCYFGKAKDFVSLKFKSLNFRSEESRPAIEQLEFIMNNVDILAIEELDKVYQSDDRSMPNVLFHEFLSDVYDENIPLLVSSNTPRGKFEQTLPPFIGDRLKTLIDVPFTGHTRRKDRRKK